MRKKRGFQRFPLNLQGRCVGAGADTPCRIVDISTSGIGIELQMNKRISRGAVFVLEIDLPGQESPVESLIKLQWIKNLSQGDQFNYLVGAQLKIIAAEDRERLIQHACRDLLQQEAQES